MMRLVIPEEFVLQFAWFCSPTSNSPANSKAIVGCAHHFWPTYPDFLHEAPPTVACAAFIKESRMKTANAGKLNRKSGVR